MINNKAIGVKTFIILIINLPKGLWTKLNVLNDRSLTKVLLAFFFKKNIFATAKSSNEPI